MSWPADLDAWVRALTLAPILICSIIGSALTAARWIQLGRSRRAGARLLPQLQALAVARQYDEALTLARIDRSHVARLVERALAVAGGPRERVTAHVELAGRELAREVDYGLGAVSLIATLGPLLGLFGTVVGIVLVFEQLAATGGLATAHQLAGGIGTALYTTVAGLIVGMLALVSHRILQARADEVVAQLEAAGQQMADALEGGLQ